MPFDASQLHNISAGRPALYIYVTDDDVATVSATGYFDRRQVTLHRNDVISVLSRAGGPVQKTDLTVESVTATTVNTTVSTGAGVTGLTNPLTSDIAGAGNDITDIGELVLRTNGGGSLTISNGPTGNLLVNGNPVGGSITFENQGAGGFTSPTFNVVGSAGTMSNTGGKATFTFDSDLNAIANVSVNGLLERTGAGSYTVRNVGLNPNNLAAFNADNFLTIPDAGANGQFWFIGEDGAQNLVYRYGANFATSTLRFKMPVGLGANGSVLTSTGSDVQWAAGGGASLPLAAKGDLLVHNGTTEVRLPSGTTGQKLISDLATAEGVDWVDEVVPAANAAARNALSDLKTGQHIAVADDDGSGNPQVYLVQSGGATFAAATTTPLLNAAIPGSTVSPAPVTVPSGGKVTVDNIPFNGAVANDGFVVGVANGTVLRDNLISVKAFYQSPGFVFLEFNSASSTAFSVPTQTYTVYKINSNVPVNVPGAITGIGGVAGLEATTPAVEGTSTSAARVDHTHPAEVFQNAGALSGLAPAGAHWGVDVNSGQAYYVTPAGTWAAGASGSGTANFDIVQKANGETVDFDRVNEIANGAVISVPAPAASNVNKTFAVFLAEGATSATIGAPINQTLTTPFTQLNFRSDGVSWDQYGQDALVPENLVLTSGHHFINATAGEILRIPITRAFQVNSVAVSVTNSQTDFTASIDNGPGTTSNDITGIVNVTAATLALTQGTATAANIGTPGQYLVVTLSAIPGAVSGFIETRYEWTGV